MTVRRMKRPGLQEKPKRASKLGLIALAAVFVALDQLVKFYVQASLLPGQSIPVIPDVFHITLVSNTGAAFSLLKQHPEFLLAITSGVFLAFLVYGLFRQFRSRLELVGFALILGGALGNILDRLRLGSVTDYFDFVVIHYPVFNLADAFIFCGASTLFFYHLKKDNAPHD